MDIIRYFFLLFYLLSHSQFPVIFAQIDDNTTDNDNVFSRPTNQPNVDFKAKGNLSCVHFNYDLYMTFFNSSADIEDFMAKSTDVTCLWKKSNGIVETESRSFIEVRRIEIKNSTILKIPGQIFSNFSKLFIFKARSAKIQEIHGTDFTAADFLFIVDLSRNEIKKLENQLFVNLKAIKEIDLSYNKIESIGDGAFNGIGSNLTRIDLSQNKIKSFKEDFFLTMIQNISRKWLPFDINMKNNEIEVIQPSRREAIVLPEVNLQLSGNKLKSLELLKIELFEIVLRNFTLENINVNASYVYADSNQLKTYRVKGKTRILSLQNNSISSLTFDDYLSVTRNVFLSNNKLTSDALYDFLKKVTNLEMLDISNNPLKFLKIDMFSELLMLQRLSLSNTSLTELSFGLFAYQVGLKVLDISYNQFSDIDFHILSSNTNLEVLDLSGTNISKINDCRKVSEILPKLKLLGVEDNNWKCSALSKLKACLNSQFIKFMIPDNPTKNEANIIGVKCVDDQNDDKTQTTTAKITTNYVNNIMSKINQLDEKILAAKSSSQGITILELILSVLLSIAVTLLGIYGVVKMKNYLKISRFPMPRFSRRNSPDTIITYDNSSIR